jgi:hypothetical protein
MRSRPAILLVTLILAGCSSSDTMRPPEGTHFEGNVVGIDGVGTLQVTIAAAPADLNYENVSLGTVTAVGNVSLRNLATRLTGTYDHSDQHLVLFGSGWKVDGMVLSTSIRGTFTSPLSGGSFYAQQDGEGLVAVSTYCGTDHLCEYDTFRGGIGIRGSTIEGVIARYPLAGIPGVPRTMPIFGTFSLEDSTMSLWEIASPGGPPMGRGRLRSDGNASWIEVEFSFEQPIQYCTWVATPCQ